MIKKGVNIIARKDLNYKLNENGKINKLKSWHGGLLAPLYDFFMEKNVFPKLFQAVIEKHYKILRSMLHNVHEKNVLELAAGNGDAVHYLANDNFYVGTDISSSLLKRALTKLKSAGFKKSKLYVMNAGDIFFDDACFDTCLCVLSLNFFNDLPSIIEELNRVLIPGGNFVCVTPVPERKSVKSRIHGKLFSELELKELFEAKGFKFKSEDAVNGALLYFTAKKI